MKLDNIQIGYTFILAILLVVALSGCVAPQGVVDGGLLSGGVKAKWDTPSPPGVPTMKTLEGIVAVTNPQPGMGAIANYKTCADFDKLGIGEDHLYWRVFCAKPTPVVEKQCPAPVVCPPPVECPPQRACMVTQDDLNRVLDEKRVVKEHLEAAQAKLEPFRQLVEDICEPDGKGAMSCVVNTAAEKLKLGEALEALANG